MNISKYLKVFLLVSIILIFTVLPAVCADVKYKINIDNAQFITSTSYPSGVPKNSIRINYTPQIPDGEQLDPKIAEELKKDIEQAKWAITKKQSDGTFKKIDDAIDKIDVQTTNILQDKPFYIYLRPGISEKDDVISVVLNGKELEENWLANTTGEFSSPEFKVTKPVPGNVFKLDPKQVSNQELISGTKKDVYQLGVNIEVPNINGSAAYFKSESLLSSESKDKNTKIELKTGFKWIQTDTSVFLDAQFLGNQSFSNTSVVGTLGGEAIIASDLWSWTKPYLFNSIIKAPISPVFTGGVQYENRLKKDPLINTSHSESNLARLKAQIEWKPIHLFSTKSYSEKDVQMELKAEGWYFPNEKATGGASVKKFEGHLNVALFVPINVPDFVIDKPSGASTRLKIEYDNGANEANGFVRSSSFKIGVEITKL